MADIKVIAKITNFNNNGVGLADFYVNITTDGQINSSSLTLPGIDINTQTEFQIYNQLKVLITDWVLVNCSGDTTNPSLIKLFGVYVNPNLISAPSSKFRLTNSESLDPGTDYNLCGLYKKRIIVIGELKEIEYYRNFDLATQTYSVLVVKEYRNYTRDGKFGIAIYRTLKADWYLDDNTVGFTKDNIIKVYSFDESIEELASRRTNLVNNVKGYLLGEFTTAYGVDLGFMYAIGFLASIKPQKDLYVEGNGQPMMDAIANTTVPFITQVHKDTIVSILTYNYKATT